MSILPSPQSESEFWRIHAATLADKINTLFDAIAHGDELHREWLKEAIEAHVLAKPIPPVRGRGNKEARIAQLETDYSVALAKLGGLVPFLRAMRRSDAGDIEAFVADAIATETRRAETQNSGSVHEGAGPKDIAQKDPSND